jgi:ABC-type multidrug transport system fused ATPase/permease subunit
MQECHSKLVNHQGASLFVDILIGLGLLTIWINWKNGYIQAFFDSPDTRKKAALISLFILLAPTLLDLGLSLKEDVLLLGPLLSAVIALTIREVFAKHKEQQEIRSEVLAELQANIRSINSIEKNYSFLNALSEGNATFDPSWPKSLKAVWKSEAMKKNYTKAIAKRIFPIEPLRTVEELYCIMEILILKADEGVDGYDDFEEALPQFTMVNAKILDVAQDLGIAGMGDAT